MTPPTRNPYLTDLTDDQWNILQPLIPPAQPGGRPRAVAMRDSINPLLSLNRPGCQWDMRPHALRPKSPVYEYVAQGRDDGTWPQRRDALRAEVRTQQAPSQALTPRAARIERQAVQTTEPGGERGDEGGKQIQGRTRPLCVEVVGLWLVVFVSSAALDAAGAAPHVLQHVALVADPRLAVIWADRKYPNHARNEWIASESPGTWRLEVVRRPEGSTGFGLLPKRGGVERTLAWLGRGRRHSQDYERRMDSSESMIRIRAMHLMLKRLQPSHVYRPCRYRDAA